MARSSRLGLPLLSAGQAQKEVTHNEALILVDALVSGYCGAGPANAPPSTPEVGISYICGPAPTGGWTGHPQALACWTEAGWRFVDPVAGLQILDRSSGCTWRYASGQWSLGIVNAAEVRVDGLKVVGARQPAIAGATGGATVDSEARAALALVLAALRSHGLIAPNG